MFKRGAKEGFEWVKDSLGLFKQHTRLWMLLALSYLFLFFIVPSYLPIIVKLLISSTSQAFAVLVVSLYRDVNNGRVPSVEKLFPLLKSHAPRLMGLGAIYVGYVLVISVVIVKVFGSDVKTLMDISSTANTKDLLTLSIPIIFKSLLFFVPLLMATWYAPMLIVYNNFSVFHAMKSSVAGVLYSFVSLAVAWIVLTIVISIPMMITGGIIAGITSVIGPQLFVIGILGPLVVLMCFLAATAIMFALQYVSYRDVFERKFANVIEAQPS